MTSLPFLRPRRTVAATNRRESRFSPLNVVKAVQAMLDGRSKTFFGFGGNFVRAVPDWPAAEAAMRRLRLTVAVSTKLNRGHLVHGQEALILPCLARSDIDMQAGGWQSITVEDSMSMVHASSGLHLYLSPSACVARIDVIWPPIWQEKPV
jgi:anaerobic selenocysteine-containing dehydrogenase